MITCKEMSFSYGYGMVFDSVNFSIGRNEKVGIVGPNGAGKSTLFKLLTKQEQPSDGTLFLEGKLAMVPQEVKYDPELLKAETIYDYVDPYKIHEKHVIQTVLSGLEFDWEHVHDSLNTFSGGQKTKLALARVFLEAPEILLLDEPTNFLDKAGKKWVMEFLSTYPHTLLIVSHDMDLLDKQIQRVLFLNPTTHKIETYAGNYSAFVKEKKQHDELLIRHIVNEQKHITRMEKGLVNLRKFTSTKGVHQRVMQERKIERIKDKLPDPPKELKTFKAKFPEPVSVGQVPLRIAHIRKAYGENIVLNDLSFEVMRGERIALIGPNGAGKTTLVKILTKQIQPDVGQVIASDSLSLGCYSQESANLDDSQTVAKTVQQEHALSEEKIPAFLMRFLFSPKRLHQKVGTLSGGEKTRLSIALLMTHPYNVLVLDEPTTYLDVLSQRIILEALKSYTGALVLVSHTEEFISELQPHRVLLLPEQKICFWSSDLLSRIGIITEGE